MEVHCTKKNRRQGESLTYVFQKNIVQIFILHWNGRRINILHRFFFMTLLKVVYLVKDTTDLNYEINNIKIIMQILLLTYSKHISIARFFEKKQKQKNKTKQIIMYFCIIFALLFSFKAGKTFKWTNCIGTVPSSFKHLHRKQSLYVHLYIGSWTTDRTVDT